MANHSRVSAGVPTGGQFAVQMHSDGGDLTVEPEYIHAEADDGFPEPEGIISGNDSGMIQQYPATNHTEDRLLKMQFGKPDLADSKQRAFLDDYRSSDPDWQRQIFASANRNEGDRWNNLTNRQDHHQGLMMQAKGELDAINKKWIKRPEDKAKIDQLEDQLHRWIAMDREMTKELAAFNRDWDPFGQGM